MITIYTIGHSTRPVQELIELLKRQGVERLVDIRSIPRSRHNPQYNKETLRSSLSDAEIDYVYLKSLGGLRPVIKDSKNTAWRNASFRNFADYMQTGDFVEGVEELVRLASEQSTAIMCAEAVPWRCHRSLVSDALLTRGIKSLDIIGKGTPTEHKLTSFAVADGTRVTYPAEIL